MNDSFKIVRGETTPLVSVLVITYNQEEFITQALESVLSQHCDFDFEIVIGEDCSTDLTRELCIGLQKKYPDKIRLLLNEQNKGVIRNFYDTLFACKGKYIAECAGDDFWIDPLKLQKQVDILEADPEVVLVHTNWNELLVKSGTILHERYQRKIPGNEKKIGKEHTKLLMNQTNWCFANTCSACYRKEVAEDVFKEYPQFFSDKKYPCEDYQLIFFLLQKGYFYFLDEPTITYRIFTESVSNSLNPEKAFRFQYGVLILRLDLFRKLNLNVFDAEVYLRHVAYSLSRLAFKARQKVFAEQAYEAFRSIAFDVSWSDKLLFLITKNRTLLAMTHPFYLLARKIKYRLRP